MYFLGLTEASTARRIAARDPARFRCATLGGLAAVCALACSPIFWRGRAQPLERLLDVQRLVEMAAAEGGFVAAAPGAEISGPAEALAALGEDLTPFAVLLDRFGLSREHRIAVTWDARATLRAFAERDAPELALARARGRDRFGVAIAEAMGAERRRLADWALSLLHEASEDLLALPTRGDDQILNVVAMTAPDGEARIADAMTRIAAALPGEPRLRRVGPLPAASFAVIELRRADEAASLYALRAAFRPFAPMAPPDDEAFPMLGALAGRRGGDAIASIRIAAGART